MNSIAEIIKKSGGPTAIQEASERRKEIDGVGPLSANSVHKWKRNGIPGWRYPLLSELTGMTINQIAEINHTFLSQKKTLSEAA